MLSAPNMPEDRLPEHCESTVRPKQPLPMYAAPAQPAVFRHATQQPYALVWLGRLVAVPGGPKYKLSTYLPCQEVRILSLPHAS